MLTILEDPGIRFKLLLLIFFLIGSFKPIKEILLGLRSKNWRRTKAIVSVSGIDRESGVYYPKIIYSYIVNGHELTNDTYTFSGAITRPKSRAIAISKEYPVGKEIFIYVNPDDKTRTVVVPGVHWSYYANIVFVFIFFTAAAFIIEILNFIWPGCQPSCT